MITLLLPAIAAVAAAASLTVGLDLAGISPNSSPVPEIAARGPEAIVASISHQHCRCFPGDACWPTHAEWSAFNKTVGGRLIATVPIAASCHDSSFGAYDAAACASIQSVWNYLQTHYVTSSSPMAPFFANASCDPFTAPSDQCVLGTYVQYAVNATGGADDYKATLAFAARNNIRLVIRNTGHDYFGKSTGAGGLALWTHHLKETEFIADYASPAYSGKAFKLGAGVQFFEAYAAAAAAGVTVVGGSCDMVGLAGGHGPLISKFGLGADQVVEWEVVTAAGDHLVASPTENEDLYWALSGGGGGTYAAVLSVTVRAHEDFVVSGANLNFTSTGVSDDAFYGAVAAFLMSLPALADAGSWSNWQVAQGFFGLQPVFAPGLDKAGLQALLQPTLDVLGASGITYGYQIFEYDTLYEGFMNLNPVYNISGYNFGGRLIPRSLVETTSSTATLIDALKVIIANGGGIGGNHFNVSRFPTEGISNSVNPIWCTSIFDAALGLAFDYENFTANYEIQKKMKDTLMPALEAIRPGGGSYLNEADFRQPDWQTAFYGSNYATLQGIKDKYDPQGLFYGLTAVGSDRWAIQADGRLCRTYPIMS